MQSLIASYLFKLTSVHQTFVRLACLKCAASVHPEPESNSCLKFSQDNVSYLFNYFVKLTGCYVFHNFPFYLAFLLFIFQCALKYHAVARHCEYILAQPSNIVNKKTQIFLKISHIFFIPYFKGFSSLRFLPKSHLLL